MHNNRLSMLFDRLPKIFGKPFGKAFDIDAMCWIQKRLTVDSTRNLNISSLPLVRSYAG